LMKFVFEEQGFTNQAARDRIWSTASFAALIAAIVGRIAVGWLADRMSRKTVMVATYAQVAIAIPFLFLVTPRTPQYAYLFAIALLPADATEPTLERTASRRVPLSP